MSELFEVLPEVGDPEKPKLVFFFDEAHLLFDDAPKALLDKVEQVVRLIRSKGVGVYFVTQNPLDVPETVLGQLGNRVQHALRAYHAARSEGGEGRRRDLPPQSRPSTMPR
jgi:DNA helicase HerA-like ATPase